MAYFWEEEEEKDTNPWADISFGEVGDTDFGDFGDISFDDAPTMTPFESSLERLKKSYGTFASDYLPDFLHTPDVVRDWGKTTEEDAKARLENYRSQYLPDITEEEWQDVLPSIWEKMQENAAQTAGQFGGAVAGGKLLMSSHPYLRAAGAVIEGVTYLSSIPPIMDEVVQEHAQAAGIRPEDMTQDQKWNAYQTSAENWVIENINPARWFKSTGGKPVPKNAEELEKFLGTAEKDKLIKKMSTAGKEGVKSGLVEGATEVVQSANTARTSALGMDAKSAGEYITDFAVGAGIGTTAGTGVGYRNAGAHNRLIKEGTRYLEDLNLQNKLRAGTEYRRETNAGPAPFKFDVTPKQYQVPTQQPTYVDNLTKLAKEKLLGRSTNMFQDMLAQAKTGKDVHQIHNELFSMFGDVETGSGLEQAGLSFNTLKHQKLGEYATDFAKIKQKWAKSVPLAGEMFGRIDPIIDQYIGASLEGKSTADIDIDSIVSGKDKAALDTDIESLRTIYNNVHKDLKGILKDSDVSLGYTKDYLTRGLDTTAVENNKEGFIQSLIDDVGIDPTEAEAVYNEILNGKDPSVLSSEQIRMESKRKGTEKTSFEKRRSHKWGKLNTEFRKNSAMDSMQEYLLRASARAASAQTFGGRRAEKLTRTVDDLLKRGVMSNDQAQTVWDMYDAEHHIYKRPTNELGRTWQQTSKGLSSVTAVSLLGMATISSLTEPMWIPGRVGFANMVKATPIVAGHVLKGIKRTIYSGKAGAEADASFGRDLLNTMGMAINPQVNERIEMLMSGDINPQLTKWFRSPGGLFLTQYTNFVRVWTAAAGLKMIQDQANKVNRLKGRNLQALKRELKENGMTLDDFKKVIRAGNGEIDIMNDEFLGTRITLDNNTNISVRDLVIPWVRKITTDVALEPHVGNRPLWMSDPNLQLVAQLKAFPILFGNTVMKRTMRQLNPKTCTPQIVGAIGAIGATSAALAMAALATAIKDELRGNEEDRGIADWVGALGVPYAGTQSVKQLIVPAGASTVDKWVSTPFKDEGSTAENILDLLTRTTLGAIAAEELKK